MKNNPIEGQSHLDWLSQLCLHETEFFISFYYIDVDAIGPAAYVPDDGYENWYDDYWFESYDEQIKEVRKLNRKHAHRFRKKNDD